jgi:hypothetical protein
VPGFLLLLRIFVILIGISLLCASLFFYEDEEGRLQSKLEGLWVSVDGLRKKSLSKHTAFMLTLTGYISSGLNRIFGIKLISVRAIAITICYAIAFEGLVYFFLFWRIFGLNSFAYDYLYRFIFWFFIATLTAFLRGRITATLWCGLMVTTAINDLLLPFAQIIYDDWRFLSSQYRYHLYLLFGFLVELIFFTASIVFLRLVVKKISKTQSFFRVVMYTLLGCLPIVMTVVIVRLYFVFIFSGVHTTFGNWLVTLQALGLHAVLSIVATSGLFIVSALIFACFGLLMIFHRLLWPLIQRPLYLLQKQGIARRSKLLGVIGVVLIGVSIGKYEWVEKIVDKLNPFN